MTIIVIGVLAGFLYLLQREIYRRLWNRAVTVTLRFADRSVYAGGRTILSETVENRYWLPLSALKVKFQCSGDLRFAADSNSTVSDMYYRNDLFCLMPYRRIIRQHHINCPKRGYYGINGIDLVGADLFLSAEMLESRTGETWVYVFPALFAVPELLTAVKKISGEVASRRHLMTDPFAYRGIREYTPFDEVKTINWKASAKTDELKVNIYDYTAVRSVEIYLNLVDRNSIWQETQLEKAIGIGAYLLQALLKSGHNTALYSNGRDCINHDLLRMEGIRDSGQLEHIYRMLARIDLKQTRDTFAQCFEKELAGASDRTVVIISADYQNEFQDFLLRLEQEFIWVCPCKKGEAAQIRSELCSRTMVIPDRN